MPTHDVSAVHSTVPMSLHINHHPPLTGHSLVDTGALQANYLDSDTADKIQRMLEAEEGASNIAAPSGAKCDEANSACVEGGCKCKVNEKKKKMNLI